MSGLETIVAKFYDKSGRYVVNLNVKSRYQGSTKENIQKTDVNGLFIFQASPNRIIEILAKPPNESEFTVFKIRNSSSVSSEMDPIKIQLPRTIEEYKQARNASQSRGVVSTLFKVVDSTGKVMSNFPVQSRPKGKNNSPDKYTNKNGIVEVLSSPNRDIEVLVLAPNDQFQLKVSMNSGNGTTTPILIKLDHPYSSYKSKTELKILDRDGSDYILKKTNVEMALLDGSGTKHMFAISNGKTMLYSMVGQNLQFTVFKPDGRALNSVLYTAKRVNEQPLGLRLDVDVTSGTTAQSEPSINRQVTVNILITMDQMVKMWPKAKVEKMKPILDELNKDLIGYKLDTRLRQAHFMAQVRQEVGYSFSLREQVEYMGAEALKKIGYYRTHPKQADIDGFKKGKGPANGEVIANRMYDDNYRVGIYKLGNTAPGDGWRYLGRGLKQLTGKFNYQDLTKMYSTIWTGENVDFVKNPELIEEPKYAVRSAIRFWLKFKLYEIADKGATGTQVDAITKVINEATDSYSARREHFVRANKIFV